MVVVYFYKQWQHPKRHMADRETIGRLHAAIMTNQFQDERLVMAEDACRASKDWMDWHLENYPQITASENGADWADAVHGHLAPFAPTKQALEEL